MSTKKTIKGKAIYSPIGLAAMYAAIAVSLFVGCLHGCQYCFLRRGKLSHSMGGAIATLKKCFKDEEHAFKVFCKELSKWKDEVLTHGLFFTFTSDPCLDNTLALNWRCIGHAVALGIKCSVLTKRADWLDSIQVRDVIDNFKHLLCIGFTLTGRDDLEPNASPNDERIAAMKRLHDEGVFVWASLEPMITCEDTLRMIRGTIEFCDHYKCGILTGGRLQYSKDDVRSFKATVDQLIAESNATIYWKQDLIDFIS